MQFKPQSYKKNHKPNIKMSVFFNFFAISISFVVVIEFIEFSRFSRYSRYSRFSRFSNLSSLPCISLNVTLSFPYLYHFSHSIRTKQGIRTITKSLSSPYQVLIKSLPSPYQVLIKSLPSPYQVFVISIRDGGNGRGRSLLREWNVIFRVRKACV